MKSFFICGCLMATMFLHGAIFSVDPGKASIVVPEKSNAAIDFAAKELQYHLGLVTGIKIPITRSENGTGYRFHVGIVFPGDKAPLKLEEARWRLTPGGAYFYGGDRVSTRWNDAYQDALGSCSGTIASIYDFLYEVLKIRHIEPGEAGIVFRKQNPLVFPETSGRWYSPLEMRNIREGISWWKYIKNTMSLPPEFVVSDENVAKWKNEVNLWLKRMRMGIRIYPNHGHGFTDYWKRFGKTHPEYFAMNSAGKREPGSNPATIQLCLSNPALIECVFQDRLAKYRLSKGEEKIINLCPNDSASLCQCPDCTRLGSPSDRFTWFANRIMEKYLKVEPEGRCVYYAYLNYVEAPEKTRVHPRAIIGFCSIFLNLPKMEKYYRGWRDMGLKQIFFRPNSFHVNLGLPMGYEKEIFKEFQLAYKYGVMGTDIDSLHNFWSANGIAPYILARSFTAPEKSFEDWEDEYCGTYGNAKEQVRNYYRYLRNNIWEARVLNGIYASNMFDDLRSNLVPNIRKLVFEKDYIEAGKFLEQAKKANLSAEERKRLDILILENRHALLTVRAIQASNLEKMKANKELLAFRIQHKDDLHIFWPVLFHVEQKHDLTGMKAAAHFNQYSYVRQTPENWYFEPDEKNVGEKEKWFAIPYEKIRWQWTSVPITMHWEDFSSNVPKRLADKLKKYDGTGWYAQQLSIDPVLKGKKIYLHFEAVDEDCKVYVNGKFAGAHPYVKPDDWKTPFAIRIDPFIDWKKPSATAVVKVFDGSGGGGIWKPVWITAE